MRAEDFRAMFRHVVQRLREKGVTNAVTIMNYMGAPKFGVEPWFGELYPGDDVADWVAYDPYGMGEPGFHGGDFGDLVNRGVSAKWPGMYNWLTKFHPGRPIMLGEWGVGEFTRVPQNKAKVFETMSGLLGKFPAIKALVYFDSPDAAPFGDTRIDSTPASLAAYRRLTSGQPFAAVGPPHLT
jgi:beta-mannanase